MSKYIVDIGSAYETNARCNICYEIDKQFDMLMKNPDQTRITWLDEFLVTGYGLSSVYESQGQIYDTHLEYMSTIESINEDVINKFLDSHLSKKHFNKYKAIKPTMLCSRWCRECGSRKHDIVDTRKFLDLQDFKVNYTIDKNKIRFFWKKINYLLDYTVNIYRHNDLQEDFELIYSTADVKTITETFDEDDDRGNYYNLRFHNRVNNYVDVVNEDGRAYFYKIDFVDEINEILYTQQIDFLYECVKDYIPKTISNLRYSNHTYLEYIDGQYVQKKYIRALYDEPDDEYYNDVIFRVNADYVPPSPEFYDTGTYEFDKNIWYPVDENTSYFVKAYVRSKLYQQYSKDHARYRDLYFYNSDTPVYIIPYGLHENALFNLEFEYVNRTVTISYELNRKTSIQYVRIMFKQVPDDNSYITDDDDGTYKIVDVPVSPITDYYRINISGIASGSYWVFGVFPVYKDCDPEISLENQKIIFTGPAFESDKYYSEDDFYYCGHWHKDDDFIKFKYTDKFPPEHDVQPGDINLHESPIMVCDNLIAHDVGVLLINELDVSECIEISFDYKMYARLKGPIREDGLQFNDVFNFFVNAKHLLREENTGKFWHSYSKQLFLKPPLTVRWELMKFIPTPWTAAFVDNVHIISKVIKDIATINFSRDDSYQLFEAYYYNHKIKYNRKHTHQPKRYYNVDINIYQYVHEITDDNNYMDYLTYEVK